ncbi:hypothetical protein [Burkholderia sp. Ac-20344]|uniref:hypothetical protein n=1 Tax=Burkholderia sp. Ac-20344 TaxID=2703890 RepID=UPI00197B3386|nr:hypothetical protein [Burkholderia sp. Ac-20344]MBN3833956.1 hypothetical protein [Burkholderia sp. Ac-20344]
MALARRTTNRSAPGKFPALPVNRIRLHPFNDRLAPSAAEEKLNAVSGMSWPLHIDYQRKCAACIDCPRSRGVAYADRESIGHIDVVLHRFFQRSIANHLNTGAFTRRLQ